jgi:hypothetical protein
VCACDAFNAALPSRGPASKASFVVKQGPAGACAHSWCGHVSNTRGRKHVRKDANSAGSQVWGLGFEVASRERHTHASTRARAHTHSETEDAGKHRGAAQIKTRRAVSPVQRPQLALLCQMSIGIDSQHQTFPQTHKHKHTHVQSISSTLPPSLHPFRARSLTVSTAPSVPPPRSLSRP